MSRQKALVPLVLLVPLVPFFFFAGLAKSGTPEGKKYALLIGVNKYDTVKAIGRETNLNFADNDAEQIAKTLTNNGYPASQIVTMTTAKPGSETLYPRTVNIRKQLQTLANQLQPGDSILVSFSGYEMQYAGSGDYYLCPADADEKKKESLISLEEICTLLEKSKAAAKMVVVDACRNLEGIGAGKAGQPKFSGEVGVLFACSAGEMAYEVADKRQGLLSYYFCEGLRGGADSDKDGKVKWIELVGYVQTQVPAYGKTKLNIVQRPELLGATRNAEVLGVQGKK